MRRVQRDDTVEVLTGKDRGKRGQVREVFPGRERIVVQGVNIVKRHMRARAVGGPAGIVEREASLHWSNVAVVCSDCDQAVRVAFRVREDGTKVRFCKRCNEDLD